MAVTQVELFSLKILQNNSGLGLTSSHVIRHVAKKLFSENTRATQAILTHFWNKFQIYSVTGQQFTSLHVPSITIAFLN